MTGFGIPFRMGGGEVKNTKLYANQSPKPIATAAS